MLHNLQSLFLISTIFLIIFIGNYLFIKYFTAKKEDNTKEHNIKDKFLSNSMGSILILFGTLKLYDLNNFSDIFLKYNIISQKFSIYSYIYPFIEIILGVLLFLRYRLRITYILIIILMTISLISVSISLYQYQNLRCGCLGNFFDLPLSYVTISENVVMLLMSVRSYTTLIL